MPFLIVSDFIFFENFFHIKFSKNSGAEPIPIKPFIWFSNNSNKFREIHEPILEPTKIKLFFFTIFFIKYAASFVHFEILPLINFPDDLPWPEYSRAKKPRLFFFAKFKKALGFFPSKSDINPWRKTT